MEGKDDVYKERERAGESCDKRRNGSQSELRSENKRTDGRKQRELLFKDPV